MRWLICLLLTACLGPGTEPPKEPGDAVPAADSVAVVDTDGAEDSERVAPVDTDPPASEPWTSTIEPTSPGWLDDLRCTPHGRDVAEVVVTWTVNGHPHVGTDDLGVGDLVPHLEQAGGQVWQCRAEAADGTVEVSPEVTIAGPMALVQVEPGTYVDPRNSSDPGDLPITLTRPYLLAALEAKQGLWTQAGMSLPAPATPEDVGGIELGPERPIHNIAGIEALTFLNALSTMDGLSPCYSCVGDTCSRVGNSIYECEGYRLPTPFEWLFAGYERGAHTDDLPAGGNLPEYIEYMAYPEPVEGPNAAPGATVADQCTYATNASVPPGISDEYPGARQPDPGGNRQPNALGLYDMVGNVAEFMHGSWHAVVDVDPENYDPLWLTRQFTSVEVYAEGMRLDVIGNIRSNSVRPRIGLRIARSHTPIPNPSP